MLALTSLPSQNDPFLTSSYEYDKTRRFQKQLFCQFLVNPVVKSRKIVRIKDEVNNMKTMLVLS